MELSSGSVFRCFDAPCHLATMIVRAPSSAEIPDRLSLRPILAGVSAADMTEVRRGCAAVLTSLMRVLGSLMAPPSGPLSDDASVVLHSSVARISPSLVAMITGFVRVSFHNEDLGWLQSCGEFDVVPRFTRSLAHSLDY